MGLVVIDSNQENAEPYEAIVVTVAEVWGYEGQRQLLWKPLFYGGTK